MSKWLYDRTIENGGGTYEMHNENGERADITFGYSVGMVDGTFAYAPVGDRRIYNYGVARCISEHPEADAIGTWVDGDTIHIDPAEIFADEDSARDAAIKRNQKAYYIIHEQREVRI